MIIYESDQEMSVRKNNFRNKWEKVVCDNEHGWLYKHSLYQSNHTQYPVKPYPWTRDTEISHKSYSKERIYSQFVFFYIYIDKIIVIELEKEQSFQ